VTTEEGKLKMASKKTRKRTSQSSRIIEGSGNVFAELGLINPEHELLKAKLLLRIYRTIKERRLTQAEAGKVLGIKQPHVSSLMRGQFMEFLTALGHDIEIAVTLTRGKSGEVSVTLQ